MYAYGVRVRTEPFEKGSQKLSQCQGAKLSCSILKMYAYVLYAYGRNPNR